MPIYDEWECPTDNYCTVHVGSIYEYQSYYIGESDVRMYLEDGDDNFRFIDITYEHIEEYFERI